MSNGEQRHCNTANSELPPFVTGLWLVRTGVNDPTIAVVPIVQEAERDQWNSFAAQQNPIWYQESIDHEGYTEQNNFSRELFLLSISTIPKTVTSQHQSEDQAYPIGLKYYRPEMITNVDILNSSKQTEELYHITKEI
eukprot:scaffold580_cov72-Cylindrotheca_fusiformis.AAC.2